MIDIKNNYERINCNQKVSFDCANGNDLFEWHDFIYIYIYIPLMVYIHMYTDVHIESTDFKLYLQHYKHTSDNTNKKL